MIMNAAWEVQSDQGTITEHETGLPQVRPRGQRGKRHELGGSPPKLMIRGDPRLSE